MPSSELWLTRFGPGGNRRGRRDPGAHQDPDSAGGRSLALVVTRKLNKQTPGELGIAEKTVKVDRARVMETMRAGSLPELVQLAGEAGVIAVKL